MGVLDIDITTFFVGGLVLTLGLWFFRSRRQNLPPGPMPLPIMGNLLALGKAKSTLEAFYNYKKQYGNIFTLYFGSHPVIVLCGHKMIREALVNNADFFSTRPSYLTTFVEVYKNKGILWDPHNWKANRKSTLVTMKDFGLGKHSLEERVCEEAISLCDMLEPMEGQAVNLHMCLSKAFSNVICTIVFGHRFEYDDPQFTHLMKVMDDAFTSSGTTAFLIDYIPNLLIIPSIKAQWKEMMKTNAKLNEYIKESIEEHKKSFDPDNLRDFIDLYLQSDPTNEDTAMCIIKELFLAGTETSATTSAWALVLLAKHPEIQKKCRDEIYEIIGTSRGPVNSDRGTLPFTEATILETQRIVTIAPLSLPHAVTEDTTFAGYDLKKDSVVVPFLDSSHHDPEAFPEHDKFKPERWLDEDGKLNGKNVAFIPFSVGRRACLGEQLARTELFIMLVTILQRYEFCPQPNKPVSIEGHLALTYAPVDPNLVYRRIDL